MNDEEIVRLLRSNAGELSAVQVAELLDELTGGGLSQGTIITYFKRAFPMIPLRVLLDASAWERVSHGGLSDEGFNAALASWLRGDAHGESP
jgi:hypothetical protein